MTTVSLSPSLSCTHLVLLCSTTVPLLPPYLILFLETRRNSEALSDLLHQHKTNVLSFFLHDVLMMLTLFHICMLWFLNCILCSFYSSGNNPCY